MALLEVSNLNVSYGKEVVIKDLSFSVKKNEVLIVLGPNGAGKTTLLKALMGLIPYEGSISWSTKRISYLPPQELVMRKTPIPLSVLDFFQMKEEPLSRIKAIIKRVGLKESVLKKGLDELSTGMFQRMLIGWALIDKPDVLLFDEPMSGIDIGGAETIYSLLHTFWKEGLTIIMVTHDLNVVWEHATNVLCLNKKGLCYGPPEKITRKKLEELYGAGVKIYRHREVRQ